MFRLLVVVTVLFMMTEAQFFFSNYVPNWQGAFNRIDKLQNVSLDDNFPSVCLTNVENVIYYSTISIGTSQEKFKVVFDTTSLYLRIIFKKSRSPFALTRNQYDNTSSNQYIPNNASFYVRFLDCNETEFLSSDTENVTNINVEKQTFVKVGNIDEHIFNLYLSLPNRKYGVFGLNHYQERGGIKSIFDYMIQQKLVSSRIFSFYLNRNFSANLGGKLIFGGSDPSYYEGNLTYVPVSRIGYWQITIDSIKINNVMSFYFGWCDESCQAIVDTSVWKIIGPEEDVSVINRLIRTNSYGNVNCSRIPHLPTITFNLGGKAFDLTGKDYIIRHPDDESTCVTVFWKRDATYVEIKWVLGTPFIGRYYTEFDMEKNRVGFALTKNV